VNIPSPVTGVAGTPTGVVFTGAAGFTFHAKNAQGQDTTTSAVFTFVTEDGTIVAWGPGINPTDLPNDAFVVVDKSKTPSANEGAVYKGATIAQTKTGGPFFLYVANFRSGRIEVYDTKFKRVERDDADNDHGDQAFTDRKSGFAPFNVQEVSGNRTSHTRNRMLASTTTSTSRASDSWTNSLLQASGYRDWSRGRGSMRPAGLRSHRRISGSSATSCSSAMQGADRLLSTTSTAGISMAYSAMQVDMHYKTIACGRYALATTRVLDRAIGCSSPPGTLLKSLGYPSTHFRGR
jgi:hypothetical protein